MTKFIPKLDEISTKFSGSESTDGQPTPESESQSTELPPTSEPEVVGAQHPQLGSENGQAPAETKLGSKRKGMSKQLATKLLIPVMNSRLLDPKNPLYRKPVFWVSVGLGVGITGGAIAVGMTWYSLERSLPDPTEVLTFVRDGTLTIKAADGTILQQRGEATREKPSLNEMPKLVTEAFIASEDRRFYQHHGVDYQGIFRAVVSNLVARDVVEGGSTITQQLARITFLTQERTLWRKLKEMLLAQKIEQKLSKDQILERYLNLVYLGEGAYGVADAAWVYFSKPLDELTLPEAATLAAMAPAPGKFSPLADEKIAKERRNLVLQRMQEAGFITPEAAKAASAEPMDIDPAPPKRLTTEAPYFTSYIEQELPKYIPSEALEAGGLIVETSLNRDWQKQAETTVENTLKRYGRGQRFSQAALVSLDPRTGEVKAMVGGTDFDKTQFNRVTQAMRQPGSTFKGFVYTTAIAAGFSPYRGYLDAPFTVDGYTPKNYSEKYLGWTSMRDALTKSINIVAVKTLIDVGFDPVIKMAHKMGIKSELKPVYSLALGGSEVNLLELTSGYGTLATQGMHTEVHGIRRVLDQRGKVLYEANFKPERAVDAETTAIMTWMLRGVVQSGTGRAASLPDRPVAGKTGTSDQARDLWFIGYIPQVVTGVWLGNDNNQPTWGASSTAALTWNNFMEKAVEGMPVEKFPERPQKVEGRKGSIKAEPVRPGRVYTSKLNDQSSDNNTPSRSRRYRVTDTDDQSQPTQRRSYRYRVRDNDSASDTDTPRRRRQYSTSTNTAPAPDQQPRSESRRRRRYSATTNAAPAPDQQPRSESRRRRRSYSNTNTAATSSSSSAQQPVRRRSRRASPDNGSSAPTQRSVQRQAAPVAQPQPSAAPAATGAPIQLRTHQ